jgi:hypothetical protein
MIDKNKQFQKSQKEEKSILLRGKHMTVLFHGLLQALQSKVVGLS